MYSGDKAHINRATIGPPTELHQNVCFAGGPMVARKAYCVLAGCDIPVFTNGVSRDGIHVTQA